MRNGRIKPVHQQDKESIHPHAGRMHTVYIAEPFFPFIHENDDDGYPAYVDAHASVPHVDGDDSVHRMMKAVAQIPYVHDYDAYHHDHAGVREIPPDAYAYESGVPSSGGMLPPPSPAVQCRMPGEGIGEYKQRNKHAKKR